MVRVNQSFVIIFSLLRMIWLKIEFFVQHNFEPVLFLVSKFVLYNSIDTLDILAQLDLFSLLPNSFCGTRDHMRWERTDFYHENWYISDTVRWTACFIIWIRDRCPTHNLITYRVIAESSITSHSVKDSSPAAFWTNPIFWATVGFVGREQAPRIGLRLFGGRISISSNPRLSRIACWCPVDFNARFILKYYERNFGSISRHFTINKLV